MAVHLTKLGIRGFRQFKDTVFDFTDKATGAPLERVCFVGGNGVGKSTLLEILRSVVSSDQESSFTKAEAVLAELSFEGGKPLVVKGDSGRLIVPAWMEQETSFAQEWKRLMTPLLSIPSNTEQSSKVINELRSSFVISCVPDSEQGNSFKALTQGGVDTTPTLAQALDQLSAPIHRQSVGQGWIDLFWGQLVASIKGREQQLIQFQKLPENQDQTIKTVEEVFNKRHPEILKTLAEFWQPLLGLAGLEFDYKGASVPVQLSEKLEAYVRLKTTGEKVPYHLLSTGLRNFIFKLGHIFTVFHGSPEKSGFLFVDEPENSLYPDFLYDLVDFYQRAAPKAQLFMATHNPIVAAQFRPEERFILSFDDDYNVKVTQGVSPEGDDPNDVLRKDFEVRSIYGKKGLEAWERFKELEQSIKSGETKDSEQISEFMTLGSAYNFPVSQ